MAIMIPSTPNDYDSKSREGDIFTALKTLPNDYYVIHSFANTIQRDDILVESECDFVVFNPKKGILCIEAKAGQVSCSNGRWIYSDGRPMPHGGPYRQASNNKHRLMDAFFARNLDEIVDKCNFVHTVWFPSISQLQFNHFPLPSEAALLKEETLTFEDLRNPLEKIEKNFTVRYSSLKETNLNEFETQRVLDVFCKNFKIIPAKNLSTNISEIRFFHLIQEQLNVLKFLEGQPTVVVNGAAGTGKTIIACERAKQLADAGENVLFLCYNRFLFEKLSADYRNYGRIHFFTLDKYVYNLTGHYDAYEEAEDILNNNPNKLVFNHIIIDEAQDFGKDEIEESHLIETLYTIIVIDRIDKGGSFYSFYDDFQLIQGQKLPTFISEADCKMTLYTNCRNTTNIAKSSLNPLPNNQRRLKSLSKYNNGAHPKMFFCSNPKSVVDKLDILLKELQKHYDKNEIVILTLKTEDKSLIPNSAQNFRGKYKFTTVRKFKGLEAQSIVLVDFDEEIFQEKQILKYYVGASRAKLNLNIITCMQEENCKNVLNNYFCYGEKKVKNYRLELSNLFQAIPVL